MSPRSIVRDTGPSNSRGLEQREELPHGIDAVPGDYRAGSSPLLMGQPEVVGGEELIGRRISVVWEDGYWYEAVVIVYYPTREKYRIVYTFDGSLELVRLGSCRWRLHPKQKPSPRQPSLIGTTIEFRHPLCNKIRRGIVFKAGKTGDIVSVAYRSERKTDNLYGGGWTVVKESPCVIDRSLYS